MQSRWALGILCLCTIPAACGEREPALRVPDIVLVSIDSLRHDHLSCYGYERATSPTIDALAAEGVRFESAVSTTSWTLPAHAALFTGLYDSTHGLIDNGLALAEQHVTLAEALQEVGYQTAGFYGGPYLHPTFGVAQGFEVYRSCTEAIPDGMDGQAARRESRAHRALNHTDVTGPRTLERVREWLAEADERPFFLFLHLWDVHYDYTPPAQYVEMFDPDYEGEIDGVDVMRDRRIAPDMAPRDREHLIALYDGEIRFTDDVLGQIFAELDARGRFEEALIVVTSDHGEEFFEHGGKGHQKTLFDEVVRVPMIVRWKGVFPGGTVVPDQVRLIDLMPTLTTIAGVRDGLVTQGRDIRPLLEGDSLPPQHALIQLFADGRYWHSLRTNDYKIINDRWQLYDLRRDPGERRTLSMLSEPFTPNRIALHDEIVGARALGEELKERAAVEITIDPDVLNALNGLGYVKGLDDSDEDQ